MNVTAITSKIALSRPAVSHHLKVLKDGSFITSEKNARRFFILLI